MYISVEFWPKYRKKIDNDIRSFFTVFGTNKIFRSLCCLTCFAERRCFETLPQQKVSRASKAYAASTRKIKLSSDEDTTFADRHRGWLTRKGLTNHRINHASKTDEEYPSDPTAQPSVFKVYTLEI